MPPAFDLQGHRGARGLRPENTLPSFEAALDAGVTTIETDLHLSRDGRVVLVHDPRLGEATARPLADAPPLGPDFRPPVGALTIAGLHRYRLDRNPDPARFPGQEAAVTPLAAWYAASADMDPYAVPALADLFRFADDYAGEPGARAGKTDAQRARAAAVRFDLELKRVPFHPEAVPDGYDGTAPAALEMRLLGDVRMADVVERTTVRSFDHRAVAYLRGLEPALGGAVLVAETAPADPAAVAAAAGAQVYCPSYLFVDAELVRRAQAGGVRVVPWTVNDPDHWRRLVDWGVDGITTDFPDRLAEALRGWGVAF
jgi:glycerophosphoryl diester phosphodiesterase